jgi:signal transduction histidine kinase
MNLQKWRRQSLLVLTGVLAVTGVAASVISAHRGWIGSPFPGFFIHGNLTVSPVFLPQWSGKEAGIRLLDRVLAIDEQPVLRPGEIYQAVRSRPATTLFSYTIERNGGVFTVVVPSMSFSFRDWFFSFGIYLLTGLAFLTIGVIPCYLRSPSPAAVPLFLMGTTIFIWFAITFDFMTVQWALKEVRILALVLTPSLGIHLALSLTDRLPRRRKKWLVLIYSVSAVLGLFYSVTFYGPKEVWHWALRISYIYGCAAAFAFLGLVWLALRRPISDLDRSRLRGILVGAVVGFFVPTLGTVLASSFYYEIPYNLLMIPAVFFPLSVAYALVKYNLFDIDSLLKAGLTRAAVTAILLVIYVSVVAVLSLSLGDYATDPLVPFFFSALVAVVFNPLLRWVERGVDRYFYQREYEPMELQSEVSALLRSLSRPQAAAENFLRILAKHLGLKTALVLFQSTKRGCYIPVSLEGHDRETLPANSSAVWTRHFSARPRGLFRDEVETDPAYETERVELVKLFDDLQSEVLMPLVFEQQLLGLVSLGKKKSGRGYGADDFSILTLLADQLALAFKNGALFEESEKAKEEYRDLYGRSEALNRRLVEMDRLKRQFVANVSHELRTPIAAISGYAEVLMGPMNPAEMHKILERLVTNSRELSGLVEGLLDFSRIEAGTMDAAHDVVNLRHLLDLVETIALRLIRNRPIQFRKFTEPAVDVIYTDPKKLQQILMHLLTNAVKFTDRGEIAVEVRTHPWGDRSGIEISVSDTGIGIGEKDRDIIFEEFRQLDGSSTRRYGGTGLGLNLCRKLAEGLGGKIKVESSIGQGSTFRLILPPEKREAPSTAELRAVEI